MTGGLGISMEGVCIETTVPSDPLKQLLVRASHFTRSKHSHIKMLLPRMTHIPISFFSVGDTISTVLSSTMFINWSYPRSTPTTCLLAFSFKSNRFSMNFRRSAPAPAFEVMFLLKFDELLSQQ